jgi:pyruvate,orthophosphate dikinase
LEKSKAKAMSQLIFSFGNGRADGGLEMKEVLGSKGANLAEMTKLGVPVPAGFTISAEVCQDFIRNGHERLSALQNSIKNALKQIEKETQQNFGSEVNPLLLSVRSGSKASMPGVMGTILNLGLNTKTTQGLAAATGSEKFAWDSYRRFIQMYSCVVFGMQASSFEAVIDFYKKNHNLVLNEELTSKDWASIVSAFKELVEKRLNFSFPEDPETQLLGAITAIFKSWENPTATSYRQLHAIPETLGTAVSIQAMVFGNIDNTSASGVLFTRNPLTGEKALHGEFLIQAQGEDIVAGIKTPRALTAKDRLIRNSRLASMEEAFPEAFQELSKIQACIENHFRDMQDIEFTIEQGRLWILQTRPGERSPEAKIRIAVDMANEGLITTQEAVIRANPNDLTTLLHPIIDPEAERAQIASGLPASPGAVTGCISFDTEEAVALAETGENVILVRKETSTEDIRGIHAARGVLTTRGGVTSHAAIIARGLGRPCVTGAVEVSIDFEKKLLIAGPHKIMAGESITIDGGNGQIYLGAVPIVDPSISSHLASLKAWAQALH